MGTVWAGDYVQSGIRLSGSYGDPRAQFMLLVLFCVWEDARIWVHQKNYLGRTCLVVQWLGLRAFTAFAPVSIPAWGTKILQVSRCGYVFCFFPLRYLQPSQGPIFPKYKVPYPVFSVLNSLQGILFAAAAVVLNDLILGELDGGQCSLFYTKQKIALNNFVTKGRQQYREELVN